MEKDNLPKRFRVPLPLGKKHPNGTDSAYRYGCYFPMTDLVIGDMGGRGTGKPEDVQWLDADLFLHSTGGKSTGRLHDRFRSEPRRTALSD